MCRDDSSSSSLLRPETRESARHFAFSSSLVVADASVCILLESIIFNIANVFLEIRESDFWDCRAIDIYRLLSFTNDIAWFGWKMDYVSSYRL